MHRRPACRSRRSSRTTTWCGPRCRRWRPCSAACSRSTPTRWTRPWRCRPRKPPRWHCARSRSSPSRAGITEVSDPLGGSYAVERLTSDLEAEAEAYIARIDAMGGMVQAIEQGYPQREIAESAYRDQQAVDRGERVIVGVNESVGTVGAGHRHALHRRRGGPHAAAPVGGGPLAARRGGVWRSALREAGGRGPKATKTPCRRCSTRFGRMPLSAKCVPFCARPGANTQKFR